MHRMATVPVDLLNPGQVFACLGLAELTEQLLGVVEAGFEESSSTATRFRLTARGADDPLEVCLSFLARAEVTSMAPAGSELSTERWSVPTTALPADTPFPMRLPDSPATLPVRLQVGDQSVVVDHWGDATRRDNVKFWAGAGGYPGAGLMRDALDIARDALTDPATREDPFAFAAPQRSSFRFEWSRDYVPLGIGFSINEHTDITPQGRPIVELLAAIGLTHARPLRPDRRDKLTYRYAVATVLLPLPLLRAALGCADLPFPMRTFRTTLSWPGKEGQARCITAVVEESS